MRTLNVSFSDNEYKLYGLKTDKLTFADVIDLVRREFAVEALDRCVELAEKNGLSKMTLGNQ